MSANVRRAMRVKLLAATAAETMITRARQLVTDAMNNLQAVQAEGTGCAVHALMPLIRAARELDISAARVQILQKQIRALTK